MGTPLHNVILNKKLKWDIKCQPFYAIAQEAIISLQKAWEIKLSDNVMITIQKAVCSFYGITRTN